MVQILGQKIYCVLCGKIRKNIIKKKAENVTKCRNEHKMLKRLLFDKFIYYREL